MFNLFDVIDKKDHGNSELSYGLINYLKYEYSSNSDSAKKNLEFINFVREIEGFDFNKKVALDIGCATCRYPLFLSEFGFDCTGYDIDRDAIEICKNRIEKSGFDINVKRKNIVESALEAGKYSLITCMMGTFDHIPISDKRKFFEWTYGSLSNGGLLVLSTWNKDCDYNGFLGFYSKKDVKSLKYNLISKDDIFELSRETGFSVKKVISFCFLPDVCLDYWTFQDIEALYNIDVSLNDVASNCNQMNLFFLEKNE